MAYFANATEGDTLDVQCGRCPIGHHACPILHVQLQYNYEQVGNDKLKAALNMLVDEKGQCQLLPIFEKDEPKRMPGDPPSFLEQP